jgi:4-alpha-glucanotransferase
LIADEQAREQEIARRHDERWKVLALLHELGLSPADPEDTAQIADALHTAVARTPSMLVIVQLDDVLGETEPANIPGTHREYPNWRRKLSRTLEEVAGDPRLERLAAIMNGSGRGRLDNPA